MLGAGNTSTGDGTEQLQFAKYHVIEFLLTSLIVLPTKALATSEGANAARNKDAAIQLPGFK